MNKKTLKKKSFITQMIGFRPRIALLALLGIAIVIAVFYTFRSEAATAWPLRVSSNGHYLEDQSGKAYLYVGDTSWNLMSHLSVADAKRVIDTRKAQGFNSIQALIPGWDMVNTVSSTRGQAFTNNNITTPNENFWTGVDQIVAYAKSQNMELLLGPIAVKNLKTFSDADITTYGTWLANRYKSYGNVMWFVGSDSGPDDGIAQMKVLGSAIKAADPSAVITAHFWGLAYPFFLSGESWYSFYGFQWNGNGSPECYTSAYKGYTNSPTKPWLNMEPAYDPDAADGSQTSPLQVRTCAWGAILGGALGVVYGGPRDAWALGNPNLNWSALDRPAATQTGNVYKILSQYAWEKLVPDDGNATVTSGRGTKDSATYVPAGRASDGSLVVAYLPTSGSVTVDMSKLSGPAKAMWVDPTNATAKDAGTNLPNSGSKSFTNPGNNAAGESDMVLILTTGTQSTTTAPTSGVSVAPTNIVPTYECIGGTNCAPSTTPTLSIVPSTSIVPSETISQSPSVSPAPSTSPNPGGSNGNNGRKGWLALFITFLLSLLEFILRLFRFR